MKLGGIFRFELAYQVRRPQTCLFLTAPAAAAFLLTRDGALADAVRDDFWINSPSAVAGATLVGCLLWLLVAPSVAGDAAARDVETRMDPLAYTAPVSRAEYLGGRFLAALVLNALTLLGTTLGSLLAVYVPGIQGAAIGPFRPAAYLTAYGYIALPAAFFATAIQFSLAALSRHTRAAYLGSIVLFFFAYVVSIALYWFVGSPDLARLIDPIGVITITEILPNWTPLEKRTRLLELEGPFLWNRVLWLGIALGALAFAHHRFRFVHHVASGPFDSLRSLRAGWWSRIRRSFAQLTLRSAATNGLRRGSWDAHAPTPAGGDVVRTASISIPQVRQTYGFATHVRQTLSIAWGSFRTIANSWGGLALLVVIPLFAVLILPTEMEQLGVPLFPRTAKVISLLTAPVTGLLTPWVIVPLLILFYAGELVWREREAGLSETVDAAPVPESVLFLGKFLGLGVVLAVFVSLMTTAGILIQVIRGYHEFEIGLYLKVMFGLQLSEYILFAVLALVIHVSVDHKHVGHLLGLLLYASLVFASTLGIEHNLLIFGASPAWSYTEMRGFGDSIGPWAWFKLYWAAWALLLAVAARLLWVRGREDGLTARLRLARRRLTRSTAGIAAAAAVLVVTLGGFIFYNTNVLNDYRSASETTQRRVEYERRFRQYEKIPQPRRTAVELRVEIYPERRATSIRGTYRLVNASAVPIDSIHLSTVSQLETGEIAFDRPATRVLEDEDLGYRIYALETPLLPGDSLRLGFDARFAPRGFRNSGVPMSVTANATRLPLDQLPVIGYQRQRELTSARERRAHGLAPRPLILPSLYDTAARYDANWSGSGGNTMEMVVGTSEDQITVAPGTLRRTWVEGGRRYFHYATSAPIGSEYSVYSAKYAVREATWNDPSLRSGQAVAIQVFHHPTHTATLDDMVRGVQASLDYFTEQFSPYEYNHLFLVEYGGNGIGMHADASQLSFTEGFTSWHRDDDPRALDLPFAVVAHEMAHQWWPGQLSPAMVEGAPFFSESLAWYSAMQVVKKHYGQEQLRRLKANMRQPNPFPRVRRGLPLLRADDPWAMYRRGPFAMIALSEYVGETQVNAALRRLIEASSVAAVKTGSSRGGAPPLQTTLDLYRELQAVTPDSLHSLLRDLFEINTIWTFDTRQAKAEQTEAGTWRVTLEVEARKESVDTAGVETVLPMNDLVEIGIFAPLQQGEIERKVLYRQKHRIRAGRQAITVTVSEKPEYAGIDPYNLLDWEEGDNIEEVKIEKRGVGE
jgi:ABC-2 type transport system permease protein